MAEEQEPKPKAPYHHGDLSRALVAAAVQIIAEQGVDALTLRGVGQHVGVSRTALYRHFADKAALLAMVALEGFRLLRHDLEESVRVAHASATDPMVALCEAYVAFGAKHPPHYRTMFGASQQDRDRNRLLVEEGEATFAVLVQAIAEGQAAGRLTPGNPGRIAQVLWATVHGIVMLGGNSRFESENAQEPAESSLAAFAASTMLQGLVIRREFINK